MYTQLRSEAIQVNQAGYHPRQREKSRDFSLLGDGGGVDSRPSRTSMWSTTKAQGRLSRRD
jgi:hypothetical protein